MAGVGVYGAARPRLVVLAKEPTPGQVKTRLSPPLSPQSAADCHTAFVEDTLRRLGPGLAYDCERVLAVSPDSRSTRLCALATRWGWQVSGQGSGDLGRRMDRLLRSTAGDVGARTCVVLGADTPDLPTTYVAQAMVALEDDAARVVIGPAGDGGYYLIGCRGTVPDVFANMPWGSAEVFDETCRRLREGDADPLVLPLWHDVDDWRGMLALAARLQPTAGETSCHTPLPLASLRLIDDLRRAGVSV